MVDPKITFESESEYPNHDDSLVIIACIANAYVKRIMIDTRSSTDILYLDAFQKLSMTNRDLIPMTLTLTGFTGDAITPVGIATLPMLLTMTKAGHLCISPQHEIPNQHWAWEVRSNPRESK
ncbi:hypothetical protein BHM03_00023214 [Ensete ventricosum]|nr:hypothetical protein BHM03_00023214 [Ensete ventricosum]